MPLSPPDSPGQVPLDIIIVVVVVWKESFASYVGQWYAFLGHGMSREWQINYAQVIVIFGHW